MVAAANCARPPQDDELRYLEMTDTLLGKASGPLTMWSPPGYALFLAPFRAVGCGPASLRLLNAFLLVLAVWLFHRLLRNHVSRGLAAAAAAAFALYWPFCKMLPEIMTETLAVCLMTAVLLAWSELGREGGRTLAWIAVGAVCLAWLCLTRAVFGYALAVCIAVFALGLLTAHRAYARRMLVTSVLAMALCLPWLGYTWSRTGKPFYWTSCSGVTLFWMATPLNHWGDWHAPSEVALTPELSYHRGLFARTAAMPEEKQDEAFRDAAFRFMKNYPGVYLRSLAANAGRLFFNMPYSFTPQKLRALFFAVPNAFLIVLLTLALAALARRRDRWPEAGPAILFGGTALAGTVLVSAFARMLLPIVPAMLFVIVVGLQDMRLNRPAAAPESAS